MTAFEDGRSEVSLKICLRPGTLALPELHCTNAPPVRGFATLSRSRLCNHGEEGGALVEMAIVLPMLMLIVTGIFAFGITLNNYLELTDAVSIGARQLAISRGQTPDPCATAVATIEAAAPLLKTTSLSFTFVLNGVSYPNSTYSSAASCSSGSTTTGPAANLVQGGTVKVTVTYPCSLAVYGANYAPTCSMVAQTTELVQ
jgi:Flp pilus assembly protein TadG